MFRYTTPLPNFGRGVVSCGFSGVSLRVCYPKTFNITSGGSRSARGLPKRKSPFCKGDLGGCRISGFSGVYIRMSNPNTNPITFGGSRSAQGLPDENALPLTKGGFGRECQNWGFRESWKESGARKPTPLLLTEIDLHGDSPKEKSPFCKGDLGGCRISGFSGVSLRLCYPKTFNITFGGNRFARGLPKNPTRRAVCSRGSGGRARGCTGAGSRRRRTVAWGSGAALHT